MPLSIHGTNGITFNDGSIQASRAAVGFRNRVYNGAFRLDQRNSGAAQTFTAGADHLYNQNSLHLAHILVATKASQMQHLQKSSLTQKILILIHVTTTQLIIDLPQMSLDIIKLIFPQEFLVRHLQPLMFGQYIKTEHQFTN